MSNRKTVSPRQHRINALAKLLGFKYQDFKNLSDEQVRVAYEINFQQENL